MLNLYKTSQDVNNAWDTWDACVVVANDENEARNLSPDHSGFGRNTGWAYTPEQVKVELIGQTSIYSDAEIILASFNAG